MTDNAAALRIFRRTHCYFCDEEAGESKTYRGKPLCDDCAEVYYAGSHDFQISSLR